MGCYIGYSEEGPGRAAAPPSPLLAVPNVTAHPSTASVQSPCCCITVRCSAVFMCPERVNAICIVCFLVLEQWNYFWLKNVWLKGLKETAITSQWQLWRSQPKSGRSVLRSGRPEGDALDLQCHYSRFWRSGDASVPPASPMPLRPSVKIIGTNAQANLCFYGDTAV